MIQLHVNWPTVYRGGQPAVEEVKKVLTVFAENLHEIQNGVAEIRKLNREMQGL